MPDFHLFRVQAYLPKDPGLPLESREPVDTPVQALLKAVRERPSAGLRKGYQWHIGNIEPIDDIGSVAFAIGRTTRTSVEQFDNQTKDFVLTEREDAPYTLAVLDPHLGVCAIAAKGRLGRTSTVASYLMGLLNSSPTAKVNRVRFSVDPISDPHTFIERLRRADAVVRFSFTFARPNAFDANEDIIKPTQNAARELAGDSGKLTIKGYDLDRNKLEDVTRSVASLGQDARALVEEPDSDRPVPIHLSSRGVIFRSELPETQTTREKVLHYLREQYRAVRSGQAEQ